MENLEPLNKFVPDNEMGVIVVFSQSLIGLPAKIVSIRSEFPDAAIEVYGLQYRVEFEYQSRNFMLHRHDPRGCDIVVCWEDNDISGDVVLPVRELSSPGWFHPNPELPSDELREMAYWKMKARSAENALKKLRGEVADKMASDDLPRQPEWLERSPRGRSEFVAMFCGDNFRLIESLSAKEIYEAIPSAGTERTALNWKKAAQESRKSSDVEAE